MPTKRDKLQQLHQAFFTGRRQEIELFRSLLPLDRTISIDILAFCGIGGIGKSELLNQFQVAAQEMNVPIARIDPQVQITIFDFLISIHQQLKDKLPFSQFEEGLARHHRIEAQLVKSSDVPKTVLQMFARGTHAALKIIPGVNIEAGIVSAEQIEVAISTIYNTVGRKEGDFWMKPEDELSECLVADLNTYSAQHRLVLMIDTYELMGAFDEWVRERLFSGLDEYALLVIAGRRRLDDQHWQEYALLMRQVELQSFSPGEAQAYLRTKGVLDGSIADAMNGIADGHPLTLVLLVQLASQANIVDLTRSPERREVLRSLIERITRNVTATVRAAMEACAVLRTVNEDSLAYMLDQADARQIFAEVRRFEFVKVRNGGIALHDNVWAAMNEELCWRSPERYRTLNNKAAQFYERELRAPAIKERERLVLERLYHSIRSNETEGIKLFQNMAEEFVRYRLVNRLRALMSDVSSYELTEENSNLWRDYYHAAVAQLEGHLSDAERTYQVVVQNESAEPKLLAYALCELGQTLRLLNQHEQAIPFLRRSLTVVPIDSKLAVSLSELGGAYRRQGEFDMGEDALERARDFYASTGDNYGLAFTLNKLKYYYLNRGDLHQAMSQHKRAWQAFRALSSEPLFLKMELFGGLAIFWAWCGRLRETEQVLQEALNIAQRLDLINVMYFARDLGYVVGQTGRYVEAEHYFHQSITAPHIVEASVSALAIATTSGFRGAVLSRQGRLREAEEALMSALHYKLANDVTGLPEVYIWLGELSEIKAYTMFEPAGDTEMTMAASYYRQAYDLRWTGRHYFECWALTGLARVGHIQQDYDAIARGFSDAERLAQKYEFNDHLASLWLTQGHIAWDGVLADWDSGFDATLRYYQHALIYALRFNRYLLDEVLVGWQPSSPLRSIIPFCRERSIEGQQMLIALRDWWQAGVNDVGLQRPDTISPIPEGIPLLDAERLARERERGDGRPQLTVLEQLRLAIE